MSLKTATLIAIVCISISTILSIISFIDLTKQGYSNYSWLIQVILADGGVLFFLIVLYTKQKKIIRGGNMADDLNSTLGIEPDEENDEEPETQPGGFFSFRLMIAPILIKIIYVLGMIGVTVAGIVMIIQGMESRRQEELVYIGLLYIVIGNLVWRLICEGWILMFKMHDTLVSIDKLLRQK